MDGDLPEWVHDIVERLKEVAGLGTTSVETIIAEIGTCRLSSCVSKHAAGQKKRPSPSPPRFSRSSTTCYGTAPVTRILVLNPSAAVTQPK
jgi:hypothetical protein